MSGNEDNKRLLDADSDLYECLKDVMSFVYGKVLEDPNLGPAFHDFALRVLANLGTSPTAAENIARAGLLRGLVGKLSTTNQVLRASVLKAVLVLCRAGNCRCI